MGGRASSEERLKDGLMQLTSELCRISGAPGFEQDVVTWLIEHYEPYADRIHVDTMGNLYAVREGDPAGPTLMISAHSDEIGGVVRTVERGGFLRFSKLGGVLDALLVGRMVMVGGHFGVVGVKAGHAQTEEERAQVLECRELYIDVGARSRAEVEEMGIGIGAPITYVSDVHRFTNQDRFCGKGLDNRLGCIVLLALLRSLRGAELDGDLHVVVTVQEEVGLRGAQVAAYRVNPTCAIVVDTTPCGDTPDMGEGKSLSIGIGEGPALRLVSRGDVMHHGMKRLMTETAEAHGIPYQLLVDDGATTDASAIHLQREGIPTGIVTIPRRYSHSPVEVADINDVVNTLRLLEALAGRMGELKGYLTFTA